MSSRFWDRFAARYARKPVPDEAVYQEKLRRTRALLSPRSQVLELGCGTGATAIAHAPWAQHVCGIDSSGEMIRIARERAAAADARNVSFDKAAIETYSAPEASFDVILALSVLHLLPDWRGAIAKVSMLLKPGGCFVSNTTCVSSRFNPLALLLPVTHAVGLTPHVSFIRPDALDQAHAEAGLTIERRWRPPGTNTHFLVARKPWPASSM